MRRKVTSDTSPPSTDSTAIAAACAFSIAMSSNSRWRMGPTVAVPSFRPLATPAPRTWLRRTTTSLRPLVLPLLRQMPSSPALIVLSSISTSCPSTTSMPSCVGPCGESTVMPRMTRCSTSRLTTAHVAASRTVTPSIETLVDKAVKIAIGRSPSRRAMPRHLSMSALPSMVPPPSMRTAVAPTA